MRGLIIFLHGAGDTGDNFDDTLYSTKLPSFDAKSFMSILKDMNYDILTPTAKLRRYKPAYNDEMNVWYNRSLNFFDLGRDDIEYVDDINESINQVSLLHNYYLQYITYTTQFY